MHGGIPLWAELKSIIGLAVSRDGRRFTPFAAHTRANTRIDERRLIEALGMDPQTTALRSLLDQDAGPETSPFARFPNDMRARWYGLINPLTVDLAISDYEDLDLTLRDVTQVFDVSLLLPGGIPDTIMTNLGDRTRAMEVAPIDLIDVVREIADVVHVCPIAVPCPIWLGEDGEYLKDVFMDWPPPSGPRIGILTGNGPESGLYLWKNILDTVRRIYPKCPDAFMPGITIHSMPEMGLSMELASRENEVRDIVMRGIRQLLEDDCKLLTVACNTTIYFEAELASLCTDHGARFVSIAEAAVLAVSRVLAKHPGGAEVGLIGIGPVIDIDGTFSGYRRHLDAASITVTTCAADDFAFDVKSMPEKGKAPTDFGGLVKSLPTTADIVIIALTEASIVYQDIERKSKTRSKSRVYVDALAELGAYLAFSYLMTGYLEAEVCQIRDEGTLSRKLGEAFGWLRADADTSPELRSTPEPPTDQSG
jgi:aspartate/glutamate racemase